MIKTAVTAVLGAVCVGAMAAPANKPHALVPRPRSTCAAVKAAHATPPGAGRTEWPAMKSTARSLSFPFRPTEYPRIFVRNMPATAPRPGQGLVYIAPGGTLPQRPFSAHRNVQPTAQNLPDGGTMLLMDPDDAPTEVAHIDAGGRVTTECLPADKARLRVKGAKR